MKWMLLVRALFSSIFIAQGTVWGYYLLRRTDLDNKKAGEIPSNVLHSDSKLYCGILCVQEDTCAALTYHEGQCFLYNSSLSTSGLPTPGAISEVPAPDTRTFIKRDQCPLSLGYTSVPSADLCFKFYDVLMNWTDSQGQCERDGGRLIILNTVEKRDYIVATLGVLLIYPHIGLRRVGGLTRWLDGSTNFPGEVGFDTDGCGNLYHGTIILHPYVGCSQDKATRLLPLYAMRDTVGMITESCKLICHLVWKRTYIDTETGEQCFCGDGIKHGYRQPDIACNTPCSGDNNTIFGVQENFPL